MSSRSSRPIAVVVLATVVAACGAPPPPRAATEAPIRAVPVPAEPIDPAPPVEPAVARPSATGVLTILSPADGARLATAAVVVSGLAPSGATILLDGALFFDRSVTADAWGAWSIPVALTDGEHELVFSIANVADSERRIRLAVDLAEPAAPSISWPPDGATVPGATAVVRGMAPPGSSLRLGQDGLDGLIGGLFGFGPRAVADALGRWTLPAELQPGPNEIVITIDGGAEVHHRLVRDDRVPEPVAVAPELEVRSTRILPVDDPESDEGGQIVIEIANVSDGWLDLGTDAAGPAVAIAGGPRLALVPFPRSVAPRRSALLIGDLRAADLGGLAIDELRADDLDLIIDIAYDWATPPDDRGDVETFHLVRVPGDGLRVTGTFRAGTAGDRFRVAVLGYDDEGRLIAHAFTGALPPGAYDACCLPLFDRADQDRLVRLIGLVTVVEGADGG